MGKISIKMKVENKLLEDEDDDFDFLMQESFERGSITKTITKSILESS